VALTSGLVAAVEERFVPNFIDLTMLTYPAIS